ncbi:hypothetical protein QC764_507970 [Podospora pseudoanserina]|uniref:Monocarboxylate transporter n=1 Tax=Podospora pseudoanserina TaxID=2609844 RepID=A0ABR0I6H6_9PEZI|nr:hypothetical protein QC764_507970 [Podospora pseudoanserina]
MTATSDTRPDGGLEAWLSVLAGFFVIMNSWCVYPSVTFLIQSADKHTRGIIISFGIFQTYYVSTLHLPPSDISWIGSLAVFLLFFGGIISGRLTDAGYFRTTTTLGAFLIVFGSFMTSLCTTYWQLVLAQGVCIGIGNGCLLTPMMTVVSTYFGRRLPLAMGIAACGSVVGGLVYTGMARALLPTIGFGWTLRAIGFIQLGTLTLAMVVVRPRQLPPKGEKTLPVVDFTAFREPAFSLFSFMGVFFGFFYLASYARDINGMSYTESLNLLLALNGIGFAGRLLPTPLTKLFGTLNTFIALLLASALAMYTWIAVNSTAGLYGWTAFYSTAVGGVQSLMPAAVAVLNSDLCNVGSHLGIVFGAIGIGSLIGSPIAGGLITAGGGSYVGAQAFSGSALATGALLILLAREIMRKKTRASFWSKL